VLARRPLVLLAALVLAGLGAAGCAGQSPGVRVGDRTVSEPDLVDELDAFGQNDALFGEGGQAAAGIEGELRDSYDQGFVGDIIEQRITFLLVEQIFEDEGLTLGDGDRRESEAQLGTQMGEAFSALPDGYRDDFVTDVARYNLLLEQLGPDEFDAALIEVSAQTEIEVNSRFGQWDQTRFGVVPPDGPVPAPGSPGEQAPLPGP
jgi:hypothetical protein